MHQCSYARLAISVDMRLPEGACVLDRKLILYFFIGIANC